MTATEPTTTDTAPAQTPQEPTTTLEGTTTEPEGGQGATGDEGGSGEAARYRRRLRETETERDTLRGQLDAMRGAEVARLAASGDGPRLHDAGDLTRHGVQTAELLADDGTVDPAKVTAAVERISAESPHLRADLAPHRRPAPDRSQGSSGRGQRRTDDAGHQWQAALRGR